MIRKHKNKEGQQREGKIKNKNKQKGGERGKSGEIDDEAEVMVGKYEKTKTKPMMSVKKQKGRNGSNKKGNKETQ